MRRPAQAAGCGPGMMAMTWLIYLSGASAMSALAMVVASGLLKTSGR